jgi:tryptophan halogenase
MGSDLKKKIVVVGGGTAGWISALYAKNAFLLADVTVIESKDIGILGAGEGTVPDFVSFTDFLGIPISLLVKEADATIKTSVKFTNWAEEGSVYHHPFHAEGNLGLDGCNTYNPYILDTNVGITLNALKNGKTASIDISEACGKSKKVPFRYNGSITDWQMDPIFGYTAASSWSVHFNAVKLAVLLKKIGIERGITVKDGIVESVNSNDNKGIESLQLSDGTVQYADFVIDCTGFSRLLIGKHFNSEWISYKDKLTVDSALPFFLPIEEDIPPYTEAIAMKYGWMWKIPTKERYGCGYVFDSTFTSEEEAALEIEEFLGFVPEYPRKTKGAFTFQAGCYKTPWVKNCLSVGLSSGFIEPLEATSIWMTILTLKEVFSNLNSIYEQDSRHVEEVNNRFVERNTNIKNFLYFHYMSNRSDTEFWKQYTYENAPSEIQKMLDRWDYRAPSYSDYDSDLFKLNSWMMVARGTNQLNLDVLEKTSNANYFEMKAGSSYFGKADSIDNAVREFSTHREFLENLRNEK